MRGINRWMRAIGVDAADRVDVPADAAGARADRGARPGADDLLLHRRSRLELARGAQDRRRASRRCSATPISCSSPPRSCAQRAAQFSERVHLFPFGVNLARLPEVTRGRRAAAGGPRGAAAADRRLRRRPAPVGRSGAARRGRGAACPTIDFALVGPEQTDVSQLKALPNVHLLGQRPHAELPRYVTRLRRRPGAVPHHRLHRERLSDQAERVPGDGHSGRRHRSRRDSPLQRRARRDRARCRIRGRLRGRGDGGGLARVPPPRRWRGASRSPSRTAGNAASSTCRR